MRGRVEIPREANESAEAGRKALKGFLVFDEADLERVARQTGYVVEIELPHHVRAMVVHRLDADAELGGDFLRAVALGHELQNFAFAIGQEIRGAAGGGIGHDIAEQGGHGRAEISAAVGNGFETFLKLEKAGGFFHKPMSTSL